MSGRRSRERATKAEIGAVLPGALMFALLIAEPTTGWVMATFLGGW